MFPHPGRVFLRYLGAPNTHICNNLKNKWLFAFVYKNHQIIQVPCGRPPPPCLGVPIRVEIIPNSLWNVFFNESRIFVKTLYNSHPTWPKKQPKNDKKHPEHSPNTDKKQLNRRYSTHRATYLCCFNCLLLEKLCHISAPQGPPQNT